MTVTLKGNPVNLNGSLPAVGHEAPNFNLVKPDLSECSLESLRGKRVVLNIFPSLDTAVCAMSIRKFNQLASSKENCVVLAISKDLPFAFGRFCSIEGIENVTGLSAFRDNAFENAYGILLADGPLKGLLARSVVVIDENGVIRYKELVPEITSEPDYNAALAVL